MNTKQLLGIVVIGIFTFSLQAKAETFTTDLYYGLQSNAEVSKLQELLASEGFYKGPVNGNFFSLTRKALKAFQAKEGIMPNSGYFGPLTRARVNLKVGKPAELPRTDVANTESSSTVPKLQGQIDVLLRRIAILEASQIHSFPSTPTIDSVKTLPIVQLSSTTAVMNGWISSYPALVTFSIGESETFARNHGKGQVYFESNDVSTTITDLWPGATYYYRVSAMASKGIASTFGQILVFKMATSTQFAQ